MPLETTVASINFGQGIDTKTDPKLVIAGKLITLQDGIFTNAKRVTKRNGYDAMSLNIVGGGTISSPTMCKSYRNELLVAGSSSSGPRLFSYSSDLSGWVDRGKYQSVAVSKQIINSPEVGGIPTSTTANVTGVTNPSVAISGNIALYAFDGQFANNANSVYITVVDLNTGAHLADLTPITSPLGYIRGYAKAVLLGSSQLAVMYVSDSSGVGGPSATAQVSMRTVTVTLGGGVVLGSEVNLNACESTTVSGSTPSFYCAYDVVTTSSGAIVAVAQTPNVKIFRIDTAGVISNLTSIVAANPVIPVVLVLDQTSTNVWLYWVQNSDTLKYAVYSVSNLTQVLAATTAQTGLASVQQITALPTSSSTQDVYLSQYTQPANTQTVGVIYPKITKQSVNSSGSAGSANPWQNGADIYSRPFSVSGRNYMALVTLSPNNSTGYVIDLADKGIVSRFLPGSAEGVYDLTGNTGGATPSTPVLLCVRYPGFTSCPQSVTSTEILMAAGFVISLETVTHTSSTSLAAFPVVETIGCTMGVSGITLDFNNADAYQGVIQQDTLVLNGGVVQMYDGAYVSELGCIADPDNISVIGQSSAGNIGTGTFTYYVVYRWVDANGNLHQSAPSTGVSVVFTTGSTNRVNIYVPPLTLSAKQNISIAVYRTTGTSTTAYLVYSQTQSATSTANAITIADSNADATIQVNQQLYTEGGAILDNIAPPPSMVLWSNNNRVWCVDSENPKTTIEYSKTASQGTGISFSTGLLEYVVDSKNGKIVGASPMDEKTVLIKETGIGFFIGDGANDAGTSPSLSTFQFIPSDVGGANSRGVALFPSGVMFKSNSNGIYILSRGLQVQYFGAEVEAYNSQDVRYIEVMNNNTQVRFLTSSGSTLLYDSFFNQWSTFTNHAGYSSTIWNGSYVYVRTDGNIYKENTTSFLDSATGYPLTAVLSWIKAASVQNLERVKIAELLGDASGASGHGVKISFAYDYASTFTPTSPYSFTSVSQAPYEMRAFLPQQKCAAVQVKIEEVITGASGEYIDLSDLSVEIAVKRGLNKLAASQSVG